MHTYITLFVKICFSLLIGLCLNFSASAQTADDIQSLFQNGQYKEVLKHIKSVRENGNDSVATSIYAAQAYDRIIRRSKSLKRLRLSKKLKAELHHILDLKANHPYALEELVDFYHYTPAIGGGSKDKANQFAQRLKVTNPGRYYYMSGRHAHDAGDIKAAVDYYEQANEQSPHDNDIKAGLGNIYYYDAQYAHSLTWLNALIDQGQPKADIYYMAARSAQKGELERHTITQYLSQYLKDRDATSRFSTAAAYYRLGYYYRKNGDQPKARKHFTQALRDNPKLKQAKTALEEIKHDQP